VCSPGLAAITLLAPAGPDGDAAPGLAACEKWGLAPAIPCKTKEISLLGRCLSPFFSQRTHAGAHACRGAVPRRAGDIGLRHAPDPENPCSW
jgi:hypothetical protein